MWGAFDSVWSTDDRHDLGKQSPRRPARYYKQAVIDHISYSVNNFSKSVDFYDETLKILGYKRLTEFGISNDKHQVASYGKNGRPAFWIYKEKKGYFDENEFVGKARGFHVAFFSPSIDAVHKWYEKALELGGQDDGKPGPRIEYHSKYYAAYIIDPSGWKIEACFLPYKSPAKL